MTSALDTARAAIAAGFPDEELVTAVAVAIAESGLNQNATHRNANGSTDYGLWQINSVHGFPELADGSWKSPTVNAGLALRVWRAQGWNAWSVHKPTDVVGYGRYQLARPIAAGAVAAAGKPTAGAGGVVGTPGDIVEGAAGGAAQLANGLPGAALARDALGALRWAQQPETWVRAAQIIVGGGMILAGLVLFARKPLQQAAVTAAKAVK